MSKTDAGHVDFLIRTQLIGLYFKNGLNLMLKVLFEIIDNYFFYWFVSKDYVLKLIYMFQVDLKCILINTIKIGIFQK
jgi:hypothetical protein